MGFRANNSQQMRINDRLNHLTERERRFLDKSWAKPFGDEIFPMIDENKFEVLYCKENGRPNTPVNVIIGSLLLKEMANITDEELLDSIMFDARFQYALHLTSYEEIPYSDRTPSRFREKLYRYEMETGKDLLKDEIERLGREFASLLNIDGKLKRMDSLMISSSCRKMGRLELIYTCVSNLVKALIKTGEGEILPEHLLKYAESTNKNMICYRMERDKVSGRLEAITADALEIFELCREKQSDKEEYQLLTRMLEDQTKDGQIKPNKEVSPQSLQNPSDEDATYRKKGSKGYRGYAANIVEDCGEKGNIITQYEYDVNRHADEDFGANTIEKQGHQKEKTVLIADGTFGSQKNFQAAEKNNIELVITSLRGQIPEEIIVDFQIEGNVIKSCPAGHLPIDCTYNEEKGFYRAHFDKKTCRECPYRGKCPVIMQKRTALIKLSATTINRAVYVKKLSTEEYNAYAQKRNGIEGIPSVMRRRYRVDDIPARGLVRSKMWFGFKIGAINTKRMIVAIHNSACFANIENLLCKRGCLSNIFPVFRFSHLLVFHIM